MSISDWTIDNLLSLLKIVMTLIGAIFVYYQWKRNVNVQRANFINQIVDKLRFDKDMANTLYLIDYTYDWYDEHFHENTKLQMQIDKVLSYLSYICYLIETGNISETEKSVIEYELFRVCESPSTQAYLLNLYCFSLNRKIGCSFQNLIDYGIKHGIMDKSLFTKDCEKYPKRLNF